MTDDALNADPTLPTVHGLYRHYKGGWYAVVGHACCSETLQGMTLYQAMADEQPGRLWVRPAGMFQEQVEINGVRMPRFAPIDEATVVVQDIAAARAVSHWLSMQLRDAGVSFRSPPAQPTTCCGRGCNGCVWEGYYQALTVWRDEARAALSSIAIG